jgi:hypothetical protein
MQLVVTAMVLLHMHEDSYDISRGVGALFSRFLAHTTEEAVPLHRKHKVQVTIGRSRSCLTQHLDKFSPAGPECPIQKLAYMCFALWTLPGVP